MSDKVKTRFTSLDCTAMVNSLKKRLAGTRITNIYDLNTKTYVFKLTRSEQKEFLLLESGVRFHTTTVSTEKNKFPSPFAMKLRKYLKSRRLENIKQIGVERVIDFVFEGAADRCHIILELYASGNLILTDENYKIIALLRSHSFTETIKTAVGEVYPFEHAANLKLESFKVDEDSVRQIIAEEASKGEDEPEENQKPEKGGKENKKDKQEKSKKNQKKTKDILFKLIPCFHQAMIDQLLRDKNISPNAKVNDTHVAILSQISKEAIAFLKEFQNSDPRGYLSYKELPKEEPKAPVPDFQFTETVDQQQQDETQSVRSIASQFPRVKYLDFSPIPIKGVENVRAFDYFDKAVDKFFSSENAKEIVKPQEEKKRLAWKKFENIKADQENRLKKLRAEQEECIQKAELIEQNLTTVDAIINIVGAMVQGGVSWTKIWKMISESKTGGDPFASLISKLELDKNLVFILLKEVNSDEEPIEVGCDVSFNAYVNSKNYYQEKKRMEIKEKKTMEACNQALKLAERAALAELHHEKQKQHFLIARKTYWFEKFYWFITSENYLVICGRDAQQNEAIVKKYMKKGDIYMHADFHGAATVVVKNPERKPLPTLTLEEAAVFTICRSKAWESKIITSAWWVYDHQVSKTAPSGEYLPTGSFMIRGKKNFLNPSRLEMGYAILFRVDDACYVNHENDRQPRIEEGQEANIIPLEEEPSVQSDQFFITGNDAAPIIKNYVKQPNNPKQGDKKGLEKKPSVKEEVKKDEKAEDADGGEGEEDNDDDDDDFAALKKAALQNKNKGNQQLGKEKEKPKDQNQVLKVNKAKAAKLRKIKEKYGDQDEEERKIRMKLMGAQEIKEFRKDSDSEDDDRGKGKKGKDAKDSKGKDAKGKDKGKDNKGQQNQKGGKQENKKEQGDKGPKPDRVKPAQDKSVAQINQLSDAQIQEKSEVKLEVQAEKVEQIQQVIQNPPEQAQVVQLNQSEEKPQEIKKAPKEESKEEFKVDSDDDQALADLEGSGDEEETQIQTEAKELRKLVGMPIEDDILMYAVPVCAPYITVNSYKYKVKLVPGTLKKGKACKTVMSLFLSNKELPDTEKGLLKGMGDTELVSAMIGNVKLGAAGLLKIKEKEKKAKDQKKKEYRKEEKEKKGEKK